MKITFIFFMFRDVPACSGMFRNVPCSGFYRRPLVLNAFPAGAVLEDFELKIKFSALIFRGAFPKTPLIELTPKVDFH